MTLSAYLFGNIICFLVMVLLSYQSSRQFRLLLEERYFLEVALTVLLMELADIIWQFVDGSGGLLNRVIIYIACGFYIFIISYLGYAWLVYIDYKLFHKKISVLGKRLFGYAIPIFFVLALILVSPKTHWIYYIDEGNHFKRGYLYIIHILVSLFYVAYTNIVCLRAARHTSNRNIKKDAISLAFFGVMVFIGGVLQVIIPTVPFMTVGATISLLFIFLRVQNKQISIDSLTGINNRRQFNIYIDSVLDNKKSGKKLYLLMADIDKFKHINDTYGHVEGDNAIITVAGILADICSKNNDFVARYGGDEFAIVCYRNNETEVEALKCAVKGAIEHENENGGKPYELSLSIGSSQIFVDKDNHESAISKADEQLYLIKANQQN